MIGQHTDPVSGPDDDGGTAVPIKDTPGVADDPAGEQAFGANLGPFDETTESPGGGRAGRRSRLSMRHWRVRSKLAVVLLIPTLTTLVLGGLRTYDELERARQFQQTAEQVALASTVTNVVHELQGERSLVVAKTATTALGGRPDQAPIDAQIARVDRSVAQLRAAITGFSADDPALQDRYNHGLQRLDALRPLRAATAGPPYPDLAAFTTYSSILDGLVQLGREVTTAVTDRGLLRQGTTTQAVSEAKEFMAREDAALQIAAVRNSFPGDLLEQARAAQASADAAVDTFDANATGEQHQLYADTVSGPEVDERQRIRAASFVLGNSGQPLGIDAPRLTADSAATLGRLRTVESRLLDSMRATADDLAGSATTSALVDSGVVLAALIAALVLTLVIARLMLRPLRILRNTALDVAHMRLPETVRRILDDPNPLEAAKKAVDPVPVTTREEIGEVARSFDAVHEQAVRMAAEQAVLRENINGIFVNLSRRSQRLVERQLSVIDRLEADEQDPDHLASLFELDHLATRLRRNGESLLVLSGAGLAKSVPKPVPAGDVLGAAVSEIEQYARVEVGIIPEVTVRGRSVHDLVHLLAELLDNATYFSEPETKVLVRAVVTRRKALAIQITDRGVGMPEDKLAEANRKLAHPPELDVSVTRRMGLYVVARLAQRHGIEVRLRENEDIDGGVVARIVVPADLLDEASRPELPRRGSDEGPSERSLPNLPIVTESRPSMTPVSGRKSHGAPSPLDQPISLDDLVGGTSSAAGPFLSPVGGDTPDLPGPLDIAAALERPAPPSENGDGHGAGASEVPEADFSLSLPKRQPRYVPVVPDVPSPTTHDPDDMAAFADDSPTRRLPIYQSVLSRWFSESERGAEDGGGGKDAEAGATPESEYTAEPADIWPGEHLDDDVPAPPGRPLPVDDTWHSVADNGWQAAQSLLEPRDEEITTAGLPKRVPNAYLVPGSIGAGDGNAFTDESAGRPGPGALARSATAARSRMTNFQQGYRAGRHAVRNPDSPDSPDSRGGYPGMGAGRGSFFDGDGEK
jgi:signal transduction histidine kinase